jgi:prefoldin subunit 5
MSAAAQDKFHATSPFADDYKNPRGIPRVEFIEHIADFVKGRGITVDTIIRQFQEQHSKFKLMEHKLTQNISHLRGKIPEIQKNIDTIHILQKHQDEQMDLVTQFGITELCYAEAIVQPTKSVHLWLGANVMVEYPLKDALELLERNLTAAKTNLDSTMEDMAWLRDQTVICEVNTSRLYNWDVVQRRDAEAAEAAKAAKK